MTIRKFIAAFVLTFLAALGVVYILWLSHAPTPLPDHTQSYVRLNNSPFSLATTPLSFEDKTRETPALGDFEGSASRQLDGTIWFPEGDSKNHPLLVFSHGFSSYHKGSQHIARHLARNGYIVAAVNFPLSHRRTKAGTPQLLDIHNQPGDVSAVIDRLLEMNNRTGNPLYQRVDVNKIGAYGLSLGGLTTALVSLHPDFIDQRIKAAVMLAPPLAAFSENFYSSNEDLEALVISGSLDRVVPELEHAKQVQARFSNAWFLSIDTGSHLGFANIANPLRWMDNPDDLGCALMNRTLAKLDLPEKWSQVLPNTNQVIRDVVVPPPCAEIEGQAMNGLKQQWLTRLAVEAFFDMNFSDDETAEQARVFLTDVLTKEHPGLRLTM